MNDDPSWMEPRTITHEVAGHELEFHEVSVHLFAKLKPIAVNATDAVMQLMRSARDDAGSMKTQEQEAAGSFKTEDTHLGVTPELARHHDEKRSAAITQLANALLHEKHQGLLAQFIVDSMKADGLTAEKLLKEVGSGAFVDCLTGTLKANAGVFGPFAPVVEQVMGLATSKKLAETLQENLTDNPGTSSPSPSPTSVDADLSPAM